MLIDTHCHLHDLEWFTPEEQQDFLKKSHENNVDKIICIGTNHEDSLNAQDFAKNHQNVYWTYGIHPEFASDETYCHGDTRFLFERIRSYDEEERRDPATTGVANAPRKKKIVCPLPVAIGEVGLDYHYDGYDREAQIRLFEQMLQLALDLDLPVALHLREAFDDAFAVLDNFPQTRGVIHSFTGSKRDLKKAFERDFYIGVNGLATYTTLPHIPLERIILETDAPFLTPAPYRDRKNGPQYVKNIAEYLAGKYQTSVEDLARITTANAEKIFRF